MGIDSSRQTFQIALCAGLMMILCVGCRSQKSTLDAHSSVGHTPIVRVVDSAPRSETRNDLREEVIVSLDRFDNWKETGILSGGGNFRLLPGDYRKWGHLDIRKGGTKNDPLSILGIADHNIHPAVAPSNLLVIIEGISIRGSHSHPPNHPDRSIVDIGNITVSGITISGVSKKLTADQHKKSPDFQKAGGASNKLNFVDDVRLERCVIENVVSANALKVFGKNVTVDNCVIRTCYRVPGGDNIGVSILSNKSYQSRDITISNNEIYNCTDGVQIVNVKDPRFDNCTPNVIIENNDIYITSEYRFENDGREYAAAENGIDLKAGGTGAEPVIVRGNIIRGFRHTDSTIGGSGGSGAAINLTVNAEHIIIRDNIISNVPIAIVSATANKRIGRVKTADVLFKNNLVYDLYHSHQHDGIAIKGVIGMKVTNNTIANAHIFVWSGHETPFMLSNNVIVNGSGERVWSKYHKAASQNNIWINSKGRPYSGNIGKERIIKERNAEMLFSAFNTTIRPITDPTILQIPYGIYNDRQ